MSTSTRSVFLLSLLLTACSPEPTAELAQEKGKDVFAERCADCHGAEGRGPSMAELRALTSDQRREAIKNHPTAGDLLERLSAADIGDLIEYLEE